MKFYQLFTTESFIIGSSTTLLKIILIETTKKYFQAYCEIIEHSQFEALKNTHNCWYSII